MPMNERVYKQSENDAPNRADYRRHLHREPEQAHAVRANHRPKDNIPPTNADGYSPPKPNLAPAASFDPLRDLVA